MKSNRQDKNIGERWDRAYLAWSESEAGERLYGDTTSSAENDKKEESQPNNQGENSNFKERLVRFAHGPGYFRKQLRACISFSGKVQNITNKLFLKRYLISSYRKGSEIKMLNDHPVPLSATDFEAMLTEDVLARVKNMYLPRVVLVPPVNLATIIKCVQRDSQLSLIGLKKGMTSKAGSHAFEETWGMMEPYSNMHKPIPDSEVRSGKSDLWSTYTHLLNNNESGVTGEVWIVDGAVVTVWASDSGEIIDNLQGAIDSVHQQGLEVVFGLRRQLSLILQQEDHYLLQSLVGTLIIQVLVNNLAETRTTSNLRAVVGASGSDQKKSVGIHISPSLKTRHLVNLIQGIKLK
ncbi:hypothetical protein KBB08_03020 [Candidatus Gracilibacteria bacterium]|nr:hypothetical protein [Candidatus Gracilibacteria bacterium]